MTTNTYEFIAFPKGVRTEVATLHGLTRESEAQVAVAAAIVGASPGSEADAIVAQAHTQAKLRNEYIDVLRNGLLIATVGPEGVV
jgi:hypothetical protein